MIVFENFQLNLELFRWINSNHNKALDLFFLYFSYLGNGWILLPCLIYLLLKRHWTKTKVFILAIMMESLVVWFFKKALTQPRPAKLLEDVHLLVPLHMGSFPSGDTAMAFVLAIVFGYRSPVYVKSLLLAYALLIGYGRIYLGVHFPLDVVCGAAIGVLSGIIAIKVAR
jgi:membrane-associated phospholipid phosphatase